LKVLLDSCVWGGAAKELREAGHDVEAASGWTKDPGDEEVLAVAHRQGRVLVTLDKDFGELAIVRRLPHSGIVRLIEIGAREQAKTCIRALTRYGPELLHGAIVTIDADRIRFRPPFSPEEHEGPEASKP